MLKYIALLTFGTSALFGGQISQPSHVSQQKKGTFYAAPEFFAGFDDAGGVSGQGVGVGYRYKKDRHAFDISGHFFLAASHRRWTPNFPIPKLLYLYYPQKTGFYVGGGLFTLVPTVTLGYENQLSSGVKLFAQVDGSTVLLGNLATLSVGIGF